MSTASDSILRSSRCALLCLSNLFLTSTCANTALSAEIHLPQRSLQKQHMVGNGMPANFNKQGERLHQQSPKARRKQGRHDVAVIVVLFHLKQPVLSFGLLPEKRERERATNDAGGPKQPAECNGRGTTGPGKPPKPKRSTGAEYLPHRHQACHRQQE